ncbi:glycosyltransferase family 4 protein [Fischerella sp. PCC 9605]|uniref:glycosyltransferase family 4 protein n=1 Tax=Fischerella sp. PCC 9605 TaxID=1173024 RepID=UPI00047B6834|nr:glycosyltransferase family 4 protein [Fischerella sp. PCC 9605]
MSNIAILSPCITSGDAVSNDVIHMYETLVKHGYRTQIFAANWGISKPAIKHVNEIQSFLSKKSDILIYQYSVGWNEGLNLLQNLQCKKVVRYHNVTPPEFFEGINADYVISCRSGREQLKSIANSNCDLYLCASDYNAQELLSQGVPKTKALVLSPFHRIERLQHIEADLNVIDKYKDGKINILMVGRLAPNKGHIALINAFSIYHNSYNKDSRLLIVGKQDERLKKYSAILYQQVKSLGLQEAVVFTGGVSEAALKAYYLVSQIFLITSEHEGFCVPLVESMAMKLSIIAYGSSAIPSTVGKVGLVWDKPDPYLLAASIDYLARNESTRASLGEMGWCRYQENFTNEIIEAKFIDALKKLQ